RYSLQSRRGDGRLLRGRRNGEAASPFAAICAPVSCRFILHTGNQTRSIDEGRIVGKDYPRSVWIDVQSSTTEWPLPALPRRRGRITPGAGIRRQPGKKHFGSEVCGNRYKV